MQRSRAELEQMSHAELVERVLELQDILREGLVVRDALHLILNDILKTYAEEVERYATLPNAQLPPNEQALKEVWARARHALSNPQGAVRPFSRPTGKPRS